MNEFEVLLYLIFDYIGEAAFRLVFNVTLWPSSSTKIGN
jgi:hypothetical protein